MYVLTSNGKILSAYNPVVEALPTTEQLRDLNFAAEIHLIETNSTDIIGKRIEEVSLFHMRAARVEEMEQHVLDDSGFWESEIGGTTMGHFDSLISALRSLVGKT